MRAVLETVLCFVRDDQNRYLFLVRGKKPGDLHAGKYNAPGGKMEPGESPRETMLREVHEETGLTVERAVLLGHVAFPGFHTTESGPMDESMHVFLVTQWSGTPFATSAEGDLEWVPADRMLSLPLWPGDLAFLPYVLRGEPFEGKITYVNGELRNADVRGR